MIENNSKTNFQQFSTKENHELECLRRIPDTADHRSLVAYYHYLSFKYETLLKYQQEMKTKYYILLLMTGVLTSVLVMFTVSDICYAL